ncbi:peptidoglycan hydrolase FlgJ [Janthinobacterium sp. CG_23.3]|uniref:glycoside hydrolase family 73 protein n=1 Tax=unclassified Janthinobacterium TaxID=2610881 RepID=UPI0006877D13|nr:glucosaminidase domain-containing protein [Janthinobacterium sp. CG3]
MRHSDTQSTMFTAATRPTAATAPTAAPARASLPAGAAANAGFASVFQQVRRDVDSFISQGGPAAAPALSPEGRALLGRSLPSAAIDGVAAGGRPAGATSLLQQQFLESIKPWAEEAGQKLGVAPEIVAAHAALESGWGQRPLRQSAGADTNNLFGLKAGGQWRGDVAAATTTEFEGGAALKKTERFRSYPDQASAFRDYAQVLLDNPRYRAALGAGADAGAFAQGLARGGYATDPAYADKLTRLAQRLQQGAAPALQSDD